ncbi:hypothetical protein PMAYCL1PPCAC_03354, partial [Pristionchus mayeri]
MLIGESRTRFHSLLLSLWLLNEMSLHSIRTRRQRSTILLRRGSLEDGRHVGIGSRRRDHHGVPNRSSIGYGRSRLRAGNRLDAIAWRAKLLPSVGEPADNTVGAVGPAGAKLRLVQIGAGVGGEHREETN